MTISIAQLHGEQQAIPGAGIGALHTERGNLPLETIDVRAAVTGCAAGVELTQGFRNPYAEPLEATYIFPLPDRGAVTAMRMEAADRVIDGVLKERGEARADYAAALARGQRAAIAEEERPDVFTMRVGNILPGERVTVRLGLSQPLPYEDGEITFRFPLVVAPRYIPGTPAVEPAAGAGTAADTDAVPDASRISPPVLLPGFPSPVRLTLSVDVDPAGLPVASIASSLHVIAEEAGPEGRTSVRLRPGERLNRDFILRLAVADHSAVTTSLAVLPDAAMAQKGGPRQAAPADGGDEPDGTFALTVLPPSGTATPRPRDVVLVLDRSGSMGGWKMVAARRAAARIVDTLTGADRFAVLSFDHELDWPRDLPQRLVRGTDRDRFRAVEHLAGLEARGGTEMLAPLELATRLLSGAPAEDGGGAGTGERAVTGERDRVLVLVTDGQIGNEDEILDRLGAGLSGVRVHTVGIDRAVNAGFLSRLAAIGQGRCELVESEDRLDAVMDRIQQRIGAPLVTGIEVLADGIEPGTVTPARPADLFPGAALRIAGRWRGAADAAAGPAAITLRGTAADGSAWERKVPATVCADPAATAIWARAHVRDLEDLFAAGGSFAPVYYTGQAVDLESLRGRIVATSLRFGVLCRFTAFVAVDSRVVTEGDRPHRVVQPVEFPDGWAVEAEMGPLPPPPVAQAPSFAPAPAPGFAGAPAADVTPAPMSSAPVMEREAAPKYRPAPANREQADRAMPPARRRFATGRGGAVGAGGGAAAGGTASSGRAAGPGGGDDFTRADQFGEAPLRPLPPLLSRQLNDELAALRSLGAAGAAGRDGADGAALPEIRRRQHLADLGSRLDTLLAYLAAEGVDERRFAALPRLRALAAQLRRCDGPDTPRGAGLRELWDRALRLLAECVEEVDGT